MSWKQRGVDLDLSLLKDDGQPDQFIVEELDLDDLSLAFHEHRHVGLDIGAGNRDAESPLDSFAKEVAFELVGSFAPSTVELIPGLLDLTLHMHHSTGAGAYDGLQEFAAGIVPAVGRAVFYRLAFAILESESTRPAPPAQQFLKRSESLPGCDAGRCRDRITKDQPKRKHAGNGNSSPNSHCVPLSSPHEPLA